MKSGAGGNWRRFDEQFDVSIVKQTSGISCVFAVGEMLLRSRGVSLSQDKIRDLVGEPADAGSLARCLNRFDVSGDGKIWRGIATDNQGLEILFRQKGWAAILREPLEMGHAVFIEGRTRNGLIKIKDSFDQTAYKMTAGDFLQYWGGQAIVRWFPAE